MAELYVIGGASRCGKSSVLRKFMELSGDNLLTTLSTDDTLNALWREYAGQHEAHPDLMQQVADNEDALDEARWIAFQKSTDYLVERQHAQSQAVWNMRLGKHIRDHLETSDVPMVAMLRLSLICACNYLRSLCGASFTS